VRYRFLSEHAGEYRPIKKACEILRISKSGYYEFLGRRKSNRQIEREALEGFVKDIFEEHKGRYGSRRISRQLASMGIRASDKRVLKVLNELGLKAKGTTRRYRRHRAVEPGDSRVNLIDRAFDVDGPNLLWVGDITYVPTRKGFLYLATVMDAWSRKVVGWSMSASATERLVVDALEQAVGRENPPDHGLVFHDDQGCQYTSRAFQRALDSHGITQSVSRPGCPYDNAVAESFFKTLKRELIKDGAYEDREEAKQEIFKYVELYYNTVRQHSKLGYVSPTEYERENEAMPLTNCPV